jgi:hypothetical protein
MRRAVEGVSRRRSYAVKNEHAAYVIGIIAWKWRYTITKQLPLNIIQHKKYLLKRSQFRKEKRPSCSSYTPAHMHLRPDGGDHEDTDLTRPC